MLSREDLRKISEQAQVNHQKEREEKIRNMIQNELQTRAKNGKNSAFFEIRVDDLTVSGLKKQMKVHGAAFNPSILFKFDLNLYEEDVTNEAKIIHLTLKSLRFEPETERNDNKMYLVVRW